jgi:uncharacterized iron-regulated membrane protein
MVLLQLHHCSGNEVMLGGANVAASAFVLMLLSFLLGGAIGAGLVFWWKKRKRHPASPNTAQRGGVTAQEVPV